MKILLNEKNAKKSENCFCVRTFQKNIAYRSVGKKTSCTQLCPGDGVPRPAHVHVRVRGAANAVPGGQGGGCCQEAAAGDHQVCRQEVGLFALTK